MICNWEVHIRDSVVIHGSVGQKENYPHVVRTIINNSIG